MASNLGPEQQVARLQDLIAAVVRGVSSAQSTGEAESVRFLTEVGLEEGEEYPQAQSLQFGITYPVPIPDRPGEFEPTTTVVSVPILSLVRVPHFQIASADLRFHVDVAQLSGREERLDVLGNFGVGPVQGQRTPGVSLNLRVRSRADEEGITRIKALLEDTITAVPEPRREDR
jgi:Protein of unknown function (DUF2589)